jgi:hypothetical protein
MPNTGSVKATLPLRIARTSTCTLPAAPGQRARQMAVAPPTATELDATPKSKVGGGPGSSGRGTNTRET